MAKTFSIPEVHLAQKATIGIAPCPGRHNDLEADFNALEAWGAEILISLVEGQEFSALRVPEFSDQVQTRGFRWYHLPIVDMGVPGDKFMSAWNKNATDILRTLEQGGRIVVHCAGGRGRSGMIAAKLLTTFDVPAQEAITRVRSARPGAIETREQEEYVLNGPALSAGPT